ncbi:hypothetical protein A0H81_05206 [Grifola frondosa]|uniref:Alpha-L-rhamnosidase C-terminal domain-containing protein n=1 Tax=Grifola frondosa TaxID=5627 RepID=A0A1C7MDX4_GRIFR|nr:hypothetical protein A0H81_05206 [Grifola frondosa]
MYQTNKSSVLECLTVWCACRRVRRRLTQDTIYSQPPDQTLLEIHEPRDVRLSLSLIPTCLLFRLAPFSYINCDCDGSTGSAPSGPWDVFNYAPESRTVHPRSVRETSGAVSNAEGLLAQGTGGATLSGNSSWITLDFGFEVGGLISLNFDAVSASSSIALSFTESPMFISPLTSDDSSTSAINMSYDGVLQVPAPLSTGFWTQPSERLRGGFRFLTIVSTSNSPVTISNVSSEISFMPHVQNLRNYSGYFYASDPVFHDKDFLTKIWYSGAYTVQTNTIALHTGRQVPAVPSPGWLNNATVGIAGPIIVDGASATVPYGQVGECASSPFEANLPAGDMGIAVPTQFVSTNDLLPTRNALSTMFSGMNPVTGALPESGPPLNAQGSDTYHAWTLIGTYNYFLYSGDVTWLQTLWPLERDGTAGLGATWTRGHNAEGNALYYRVLTTGADLASHINESSFAIGWAANASALKTRYNEAFWLLSEGMYRDNETTTLCPQDANSMAILFNLTTSPEQASSVSQGLMRNWNDIGPIAPELPDTIAPYISGLELQAHFASGNDERALDLLRREWGYMLYTNLSVQSTLLEGFTANGSLYYRSYDGYSYDASYTSHSHGWSSGPTSALTYYVLGLTVTAPQGLTWSVAPHLSGLDAAEGGFETPLGWFGVKWSSSKTGFTLSVETPQGTTGIIHLPIDGAVKVDGRSTATADGSLELSGGNHTISVRA